ncbi:MAG: cobalt transporter CbiM [Deltaproteobacteria bacterium]|nr:cobalt transporter CbiM [Deltaproteobacteria bacterium]RLA88726.1 MAG: cobalt transporter CbiM [Deltaproteobacteria bacterium]
MHISDGVLSFPVIAAGYGVAIGITAFSLKKTKTEDIPKIAVMTSAFFVASLIHVPLGPTSVHLLLNGLVGILLGWAAFPSIFMALLLQALLFQFGGITSLGANACVMGIPALAMAWLFQKRHRFSFSRKDEIFSLIAGGGAVFLGAVMLALVLTLSGSQFITVAKLAIVAHIPIMIIEAFITLFIIKFLNKVRPEIIEGI